jgi:bifunctional DNA-binding transcriptional regulator/antitoxin component of YhaV-PrlF toxin-antitoxin module
MKKVLMSRQGRLTLPVELRRCLALEGETKFEIEVDEARDAIILRPVFDVPKEDAWAFTPEHRRLLARAHQDAREGRIYRLSESDLMQFVEWWHAQPQSKADADLSDAEFAHLVDQWLTSTKR